jgi:hypothetical protein
LPYKVVLVVPKNGTISAKIKTTRYKKRLHVWRSATAWYLENFVKLISPSGWKSLKGLGIGD